MDSDAEEVRRRLLLLDVVVQNLKSIGATSLDEFLGVQSILSAGTPPSGQDRPDLLSLSSGNNSAGLHESLKRKNHPTENGAASDSKSISLPSNAESASAVIEMDKYTRQIEECCMEWRAGRVKPYWLPINEPKFGRTQGCALRIQVAKGVAMVYAVETTFANAEEAQKACAETAIEEGVLDFIRYGGGQTQPAVKLGPEDDGEQFSGEPIPPGLEDVQSWSLQAFYEALPRPIPEPVGDKSATDINGAAWLNTTIQAARGSRLVSSFVWTSDVKTGLHGALLRLERPGERKSWLVSARFSKRAEAKAAVCLLAMSEGVGDYIRALTKEVDARLTPTMRRTVNDQLLPMLLTELRRIFPAGTPGFEYQNDSDACGCTMTIELAPNPSPHQVRKYVAPPDYRNRVDAKIAVVALAVQEGVIEFLRFQGRPPPPGYVPFSVQHSHNFGHGMQQRKRKAEDWLNAQDFDDVSKRQRFNGTPPGPPFGNHAPFHTPPRLGTAQGQGVMWMGSHGSPASQAYTSPYAPYTPPRAPIPYAQAFGSAHTATGYSPLTPQLPAVHDPYQPTNAAAATPYVPGPGGGVPATPYGAPYTTAAYAAYPSYQPFQPYAPPPPPPTPAPPQMYAAGPVMYPPASLPGTPYAIPQAAYTASPVGATGNVTPAVHDYQNSAQRERKALPKRARNAPKTTQNNGSKKILVQSAPKSSVTELYDHCLRGNLATPQFCNEIVMDDKGESKHKVWVVIGKQKYELPVKFSSLSQGQERVAKKVLEQLRTE